MALLMKKLNNKITHHIDWIQCNQKPRGGKLLGNDSRSGFTLFACVAVGVPVSVGSLGPVTPLHKVIRLLCVLVVTYVGHTVLMLHWRGPVAAGETVPTEFNHREIRSESHDTHFGCCPMELINSSLDWGVDRSSGGAVSYCVRVRLLSGFLTLLLVSYWFDEWNPGNSFPGNGVKGNWSACGRWRVYISHCSGWVHIALSWSITNTAVRAYIDLWLGCERKHCSTVCIFSSTC